VSTASDVSSPRLQGWLAAALLLGLTAAAYLPSLGNGFVWDDDIALTQNPMIHSDAGLQQFWLTTQPPDYWPMTASTLWVEWRLWGPEASGYHATNLVLHLVEVLLLWRILRRLGIPGAYLGAMLFAVHPVNVESVAWITQRKNLMAMLFYLLSIYGFVRWNASNSSVGWGASTSTRSPQDGVEQTRRGRRVPPAIWYALSLLAFILAMLSKGSVAILPLVLLGIVAWRRRIGVGDILRIAPFFLVAGILVLVDVWFQKHHLVGDEIIRHAGLLERVLGAGAVVWFYLYKALVPVHLAFFYPLWQIDQGDLLWWIPLVAAIGLTRLLWKKSRAAFFAWGYFCLALLPVMGFTDVYFMKFSLVANHYQHLALIGVTATAGAGWATLKNEFKNVKLFLAAAVVGALAVLTWRQCRMYRDAQTLFETTLVENPGAWLAHENLAVILANQQRAPEAIAHLEEALRLKPDYASADSNLGVLLVDEGRVAEGMARYQAALRIDPNLFVAHLNLGNLLLFQHRYEEARVELEAAVRLKPASVEARRQLDLARRALKLPPSP
jgi:protein O-mannosyl-transferase